MLDESTALIVVDVQKAFDHPRWGERNNPAAESNVASLLAAWRQSGRPVFHVRHRNDPPGKLFSAGSVGVEPKPEADSAPGEDVVFKTVNSAFIGTDLQARLEAAGVTSVVLVGLTTDHCVSTTARMAANLGFRALIVSDATATFARTGPDGRAWTAVQMHDSALASLHDEFAQVVSTAGLLGAARS